MARLTLFIAGLIFIAAGILVLFPGFNWQIALILLAFGVGIIVLLIKRPKPPSKKS